MLKGKIVVGLCATKINQKLFADILYRLKYEFDKVDYKLIVYNANVDFFVKDINSKSASCIYDNIDFDIVDVIILHTKSFRDGNVLEKIIDNSRKNNTPVILIDGEREDCFSVSADYQKPYITLIKDTIKEHGVKDVVYIGGFDDKSDMDNSIRQGCYRIALQECGLSYDLSKVFYGNYWEAPTLEIVNNLYRTNRIPKAFICANDTMAIAVCSELSKLGYRVPEDVLVTGFDGLPISTFSKPQISTCKADVAHLAQKCVNLIGKALENPKTLVREYYNYMTVLSESTGHQGMPHDDIMIEVTKQYKAVESNKAHEEFVFTAVNSMVRMTALESLYGPIAKMLVGNSYMCINGDLADLSHSNVASRLNDISKNIIIIPSSYNTNQDSTIRRMQLNMHLPEEDDWIEDDSVFVITPVYAGEFVCGYYAARVVDFAETYHQVMRVSRFLNLTFDAVINQMIQKRMLSNIENSLYIDAATSLPNLKGGTKWFDEFKDNPLNRAKAITFTVFSLPKYDYIYETYGINEIDDVVSFVSDALKQAYKENCFIVRSSDDEFVVISYYNDESEIAQVVDKARQSVFSTIDGFNNSSAKDYYIEVNSGYTMATGGWDGNFESFIRHAYSEMYLNRLKNGSKEIMKENSTPREMYSAFCLLMENKLINYHFQPIIDARTGEIFAYEAVMRTAGGINLSPLNILNIAQEYGRLDELEKLTLNCVLERLDKDFKHFKERNIFVNTIPGHFLSDKESADIVNKYSHLLKYLVFEVTEQDSITDEELMAIRKIQSSSGESRIAIDDYGTGHSNIVNLLRYTPQVIKIDHFLISGVEADNNKQMFIKNTVEFAALNNIKVLAEGVETRAELLKVIELGVDLIQGYYTGRPVSEPLEEISNELKSEIVGVNMKLSVFDNEQLVYNAKYGEIINIVDLALAKYTTVNVRGGDITFIGDCDNTANMVIKVLDNAKTSITFIDVNLKGAEETTFQIGLNASVKLNLIGTNTLNKEGILVPKSSRLSIVGDGDLIINNNRNYSVGIGTNYNNTFGDISINITGMLKIRSSGDRVVGIGGGRGDNSIIDIINGDIDISGKGIRVIGIGCAEGNAKINMGRINVKSYATGDEAVCIGSISGKVDIVSEANIDATCDGEKSAVIGTIYSDNSTVKTDSGKLDLVVHCDMGCCIGSVAGSLHYVNEMADITIYGEGSNVCGIGSIDGTTKIIIDGGEIVADLSAAEYHLIGNEKDSLIINSGNIVLAKSDVLKAKNKLGDILVKKELDAGSFSQTITSANGEYEYNARKHKAERLCVYLPAGV